MQYTAEWDTEPQLKAITDAAQTGPVVIRHDQQDVAVVVSIQRYERLRQSAIDELERLCDEISDRPEARGLTDEKLQELLKDD